MQHMMFPYLGTCPFGCRPTAAVALPDQATTGPPTQPRRISPPLPEDSFHSFFLPAFSHPSLAALKRDAAGDGHHQEIPASSRALSSLPLLPFYISLPCVSLRCSATISMEILRQSSPSRSEPARNAAAMNLEFKPRRWTSSRAS